MVLRHIAGKRLISLKNNGLAGISLDLTVTFGRQAAGGGRDAPSLSDAPMRRHSGSTMKQSKKPVLGLLAIVALVIVTRPSTSVIMKSLRKGLSYRLTLVVFGIMSFQSVLELTGAINAVPAFAESMHFPPWALIFLVCFLLGFLTGMVAAFIGMGYALLA